MKETRRDHTSDILLGSSKELVDINATKFHLFVNLNNGN